jgi:hypothetical protein
MITVITLTIDPFIGTFIGFILAAVLAMGKYSDESANKSFADWLKLGVYLDERHFGLGIRRWSIKGDYQIEGRQT